MDADKIKHANRWKDTTATCTQPNDTRRPSQARYGIGIGTGTRLCRDLVFFSIGWTIAGAAARGSWDDDVEALTFLRDSSIELNDYFGDAKDPSDWTGVIVKNGRVTGLTLEKCSSIDELDAIGSIEELESMSWCTRLVAVPEAVRRLNALEELYFVDPANDNTGGEEAEPTALPCFGSSSGDTPSSPCPEPRSRNLRGRR